MKNHGAVIFMGCQILTQAKHTYMYDDDIKDDDIYIYIYIEDDIYIYIDNDNNGYEWLQLMEEPYNYNLYPWQTS